MPGEAARRSTGAASLTANPEALKAYEEGLRYRTRFRPVEARNALERAIDLDPEFVMAHYHLADSIRFDGNVPEARRSIARAVQLAEDAPVPRLQRMLAQALQLRLDFRLEEAGRILEAAHREFPQETEPALSTCQHPHRLREIRRSGTLLEKSSGWMDATPWRTISSDTSTHSWAMSGEPSPPSTAMPRYLPPATRCHSAAAGTFT